MTEKQFKINTSEIGYIYIDNLKGEHMSWVELEKTLNRLYAQNKELFKENKELKKEKKGFESCSHNWGILYDEAKNKVEELSKENQKLKEEVQEQEQRKWACLKEAHRLDLENEQLKEENKELKKENQHIKNTIKEAYNNERTQLGKSVLKQLMEAIQ